MHALTKAVPLPIANEDVSLPTNLVADYQEFADEMHMPVAKALRCALRAWLSDCGVARIEVSRERRRVAARARRVAVLAFPFLRNPA